MSGCHWSHVVMSLITMVWGNHRWQVFSQVEINFAQTCETTVALSISSRRTHGTNKVFWNFFFPARTFLLQETEEHLVLLLLSPSMKSKATSKRILIQKVCENNRSFMSVAAAPVSYHRHLQHFHSSFLLVSASFSWLFVPEAWKHELAWVWVHLGEACLCSWDANSIYLLNELTGYEESWHRSTRVPRCRENVCCSPGGSTYRPVSIQRDLHYCYF